MTVTRQGRVIVGEVFWGRSESVLRGEFLGTSEAKECNTMASQ
jgi:hypothetical protein